MTAHSNDPAAPASESGRAHLGGAALFALLLLAPFEGQGGLELPGVHLTFLEALAAATVVLLLARGRPRAIPPVAFAAVAAFALAHVISALAAPTHGLGALKSAARMVAMAALAFAVAGHGAAVHARALWGLGAGAALVGLLCLVPRGGEGGFVVGATLRPAGGTSYPTVAAAHLMHGLVALCAWTAVRGWNPLAITLGTAGLTAAIVETQSRAALLGAALALLVVGLAVGRERRRPVIAAAAAFVVVIAAAAALRPTLRLRLSGQEPASWYAVETRTSVRGLSLTPGETQAVPVTFVNVGRAPWPSGEGFTPAVEVLDAATGAKVGEAFADRLTHEVPTGGSVAALIPVRAPRKPGRYVIRWSVVQPHAGWMAGAEGAASPRLPLVVEGAAADGRDAPWPAPPPAAWSPPRATLWRIALAMWRDHPWLGVGSGNFRRQYGEYGGRADADPRIYANNLFLETAATTGLIGLAALVAMLASGLRGAWRGVRREGERDARAVCAAALGIIAATIAHGTADVVLEFTGHYLLLGFALGAAARAGR